ncbi:unnamed protein product [Mortierella alpina]
MKFSRTTCEKSSPPVSGSVSSITDRQLQKSLSALKKGDAYRNRGDFNKARAKYEKAARFYPSEAHDRLLILPLCQTSMESSRSERNFSTEWRAVLHRMKEKVHPSRKHPDSSPTFRKYFFPQSPLSLQVPFASLASTFISTSTCMATPTSISQPTMHNPSTLTSDTVVIDAGSVSDIRPLTVAHKTAGNGSREATGIQTFAIIKEFEDCQIVTFDTVQEVVVLADTRNPDIWRHVIQKLLSVLRNTRLLSGIALQGLAFILVVLSDDTELDSMQGAFLDILSALQFLLGDIHTSNNDLQLIPLLSALNALLDAMVRRQVSGLDRVAVYDALRAHLTKLTSHSNVMVCFQAMYAKQALAIIGNDESLPMSLFRRGKLAFVLVGNVSNMATKFDVASAESAYQNIKEIFDISTQNRWYQGLIYVDYLVGQCSWWQLEDFVLHSKFQSDVCFQLGLVLRLEQIAVVQTDVAVREGAIKFLTALGENPIPLVPEMVQSTLQRLKRLKRPTADTKDDVAIPKPYQDDLRPVWDPAWLAAPKGILFKAVQARVVHQPSVEEIHHALKTYYKRDLAILRVSGEELDLETCFVNLAIVEAPAQREKDKQDLKQQAAVFHRIPSSEAVGQVNMQAPIPLDQLFIKRKLRDGKEDIPKTILVQGRAGVGKTTLCKKLVHAHQTGLWKGRFDAVLWLPLRQIKACKSRTVEELFLEKFFTQGLNRECAALAHELAVSAQQGKVLFVLDGLDEIAKDTQYEDGVSLKKFIRILLQQKHVVITSRPSGLDRSLLPPSIDLELETIGFNEQNVNDFISKVLSSKAAETVQRFIQQTPLIRGLVNIPVQLDVICYSWDSLPTDGPTITMTRLYQLMVWKLWCKDALRLRKSFEGEPLTQEEISQLQPQEIDGFMATEMQHLGYLAFKGLMKDHQIEFDGEALLDASRDLEKYRTTPNNRHLPTRLVEMMKGTSFLHTADADLDGSENASASENAPASKNASASKKATQQAWYFLHLTFQEYFAATWIAQHLQQPIATGMQGYLATISSAHHLQQPLPAGIMTVEQAKAFVQENKYNPRYEIMWWMVAGLLEGEALEDFFNLFQAAPRDLIGGRHQQILASCLNEARARLDPTFVAALDSELMKWLHFEMQISHHNHYSTRSMLGSQFSFPEVFLIETLGPVCSWKTTLVRTLEARSVLSDSAIQFLSAALTDCSYYDKEYAASALGKQSTLSESASHSLIAALKDGDRSVQKAVLKALGKQSTLPEPAILSLIVALKDKDYDVRSSAASALNNQSTLPESAILSLIVALNDEGNSVRSPAAKALRKQSAWPESVIQSLIVALNDEDDDVRSSAASTLENHSTLPESAIQSLIAALKDKHGNVQCSAALALGKQCMLPKSAIQSLTAALNDGHEQLRMSAATALGKQCMLPESAILSLIVALNDEGNSVRSSAAKALRKQSTLPESVIQSLISALNDEDDDVRDSTASALDNQSTLPESAIPSLAAALQIDEWFDVRKFAASTLGNQSTLPESAIQSLTAALKDGYEWLRKSAAKALGKQSTLPESAILSLIAALNDEFEEVASAASSALENHSTLPESVILSLIAALNDEDDDVRSSAASVLSNQSTLPESAILSLIVALKDKDYDVRFSAESALLNQSTLPESAILSLIVALNDEDDTVRSAAAAALALNSQSTLPESAILSLLDVVLNDEDTYVRTSAASALDNQSTLPESAIPSLIAALKDEGGHVQSSVVSALGKQSTLQESAILSLTDLLKHEDGSVRRSVSEALRNHCYSLLNALPRLTEDEIACVYRNHLFRHSCHGILSLQIQDNRFYIYTEQGLLHSEPFDSNEERTMWSEAAYIAGVELEDGKSLRSEEAHIAGVELEDGKPLNPVVEEAHIAGVELEDGKPLNPVVEVVSPALLDMDGKGCWE